MAKFLFELDSRATKFKDRFSVVIQFLLSCTLSRVHRVFIGGDSSPSVSFSVESSVMVAGCHDRGGGRSPGRSRNSGGGRGRGDKGPRHYIYCGETIIDQISVETSSVYLSGLMLLILYVLQLLHPLLLLLLCRTPNQIMSIFLSYKLLINRSQLILLCMGLL